jgi:uncharacterized protein YjiS (DUF1127 family)
MTVKQLAEIFKAKDRARMLRGEEQPRQEDIGITRSEIERIASGEARS